MATHTRFFAMALSYKKTGEPRANVVIKAHSEQNAASLASHLAADGGGSVAFSCKGENAQPDDATILARFGVVPDDRTFLRRFAGLGKSAKPRGPNEGDEPIAQGRGSSGLLHFVRSLWQAALERALARSERRRLSWAIVGVVLFAVASGSILVLVAARAAQREARLVEMARPACDHAGLTNRELHRLVRSEYQAGADKKDAFYAVLERCLVKREAGDRHHGEDESA